MGSTKIKTQTDQELTVTETQVGEAGAAEATRPRRQKSRSKAYVNLRSQVDKTLTYPADKAIALVKKLSRKGHSTITADINTRETGINLEITLPHSNGKQSKIAIATEAVLKQIEAGQIDFDILLSKPDMMAKLAKYARVLGPRGLMPNPKNNTVVADPEKRKKDLEDNSVVQVKTEKKAPIIHVQIGTVAQPDEEIIANITALVKRIGANKVTKLTLSSTMSPGVKVNLDSLKQE